MESCCCGRLNRLSRRGEGWGGRLGVRFHRGSCGELLTLRRVRAVVKVGSLGRGRKSRRSWSGGGGGGDGWCRRRLRTRLGEVRGGLVGFGRGFFGQSWQLGAVDLLLEWLRGRVAAG